MSSEAIKLNFWELLNGGKIDNMDSIRIIIPDIRRDFAEGRSDEETIQIREKLISQICESLQLNQEKSLNFIYGTLNGNEFTPLDGQQRLTTLFLLYWYVVYNCSSLSRADKAFELEVLKRFSYQTRTTTETFCKKICGAINTDGFESVKLSDTIRNQSWFTGNIAADPSVQSMLVVLDNIENELKECDLEILHNRLIHDCPVSFFWLNIGDYNSEDLYIKMNSRGKYLTSFENFKARLQPTQNNETVLNSIYGSVKGAMDFIGRINNEYSNLFYSLCGKKEFDKSMMNFFMSMIQCDQFAYVAGIDSLTSNDYRDLFNHTSANVFYEKYVNNPIQQWKNHKFADKFECIDEEKLKACVKKSISKIDYILSEYLKTWAEKKAITSSVIGEKTWDYNFAAILEKNNNPTNIHHIRQYAIWEYLYTIKPDFNNEKDIEDFCMWQRFTFNLVENVNTNTFKDTGAYIETLFFFNFVVAGLVNKNKEYDINKKLLLTCREFEAWRSKSGKDGFTPIFKGQMKEELLKLELMKQ